MKVDKVIIPEVCVDLTKCVLICSAEFKSTDIKMEWYKTPTGHYIEVTWYEGEEAEINGHYNAKFKSQSKAVEEYYDCKADNDSKCYVDIDIFNIPEIE